MDDSYYYSKTRILVVVLCGSPHVHVTHPHQTRTTRSTTTSRQTAHFPCFFYLSFFFLVCLFFFFRILTNQTRHKVYFLIEYFSIYEYFRCKKYRPFPSLIQWVKALGLEFARMAVLSISRVSI